MGALTAQRKLPQIVNSQALLLPKWRAAVGKVKAGTADARLLCIGDSTTFGSGSNGSLVGNLVDKSYPCLLSKLLNAAVAPYGAYAENESWCGTGPTGTSQAAYNPRITVGGAWAQNFSAIGGRMLRATTGSSALSFLPTIPVDKFDVYYLQRTTTSNFNLDINGTGTVSINATNASPTVQKTTVTGTLGTNTLNINYTSGTDVYVMGVNGYNSAAKRVCVTNAGWGTSKSGDWSTLISANAQLAALAPNLTVLSLGINDWCGAVSVATYTTNMQTLITALAAAGGDVLLVTPMPSNVGYLGAPAVAVQQTYVDAMLGLAAANNLPALDLYGRLVSYTLSSANGLYNDGLHPLSPGYADAAAAVYSAIAV